MQAFGGLSTTDGTSPELQSLLAEAEKKRLEAAIDHALETGDLEGLRALRERAASGGSQIAQA